MVVTAIEKYGNNKYKIYLNDEFAFVLYKGELHKYGIKVNEQIEDIVISDITDVLLVRRAKLRAMNLLKSRDYTEYSMYTKLKDNLYPEDVIKKAIEYVKFYGYIDDERYSESFIRCKRGKLSNYEIKRKLREKGIDSMIIENVMNTDIIKPSDEEELIKKLILKKCRNPKELDYVEKNKLFAYMYRKGFSPDRVASAISSFT